MENLKKARKAKKITAKQLAQILGYSTGTINKYEQGKYEPDIDTLKKMSHALGCSVDYLIGNDEDISYLSSEECEILVRAKEIIENLQNRLNTRDITATHPRHNGNTPET